MTGVTAAQKPLVAQADGLAAGAHKKLARTRVANPGFGHVFIIGVGHHGIVRTSVGGGSELLGAEVAIALGGGGNLPARPARADEPGAPAERGSGCIGWTAVVINPRQAVAQSKRGLPLVRSFRQAGYGPQQEKDK